MSEIGKAKSQKNEDMTKKGPPQTLAATGLCLQPREGNANHLEDSQLNNNTPNKLLQAALTYADMGWQVFPAHCVTNGKCSCGNDCSSPGKHPRVSGGFKAATTDEQQIREWWGQWPEANVCIRTGEQSGLFVVDVDMHPDKDGESALSDLEAEHSKLPDTVEALTGGKGGRHLYFRHPANGVTIRSWANALGTGVDVRGDGGYVVAPPSVGVSGQYEWEGSSDPSEGIAVADAPDWLLEIVTSDAPRNGAIAQVEAGTEYIDPKTLEELRSALAHLDSNKYELWANIVGMALKSTGAGQLAFDIWNEWSQSGKRYKHEEMEYRWNSFKPDGRISYRTIFYEAQNRGWINPLSCGSVFRDQEPEPEERKAITIEEPEIKLFPLPGKLGEIYEWAMSCSHRPQPHLTVNAILAAMSIIMGRKYRTDNANWPSLYFLNIAKSGAGKELAKWIIEMMLKAAGLVERIAGAGYTSSAAVHSALRAKPAHISIIDEIGKMLASASSKGNQHKMDSLTTLMEAWGRCDGEMHGINYSTHGLSGAQETQAQDTKILKPAITLLGMTTPKTFYGSISEEWVDDGFIPRFIIVESPIGRQKGRYQPKKPMPEHLAEWLRSIAHPPLIGNLANRGDSHNTEPNPCVVTISDEAMDLVDAFDERTLASMEELEEEGIEAAVGRDVEKAMRLAMVIAANPGPFTVDAEAMQWAIEYIEHFSEHTCRALVSKLHSNEFSEIKDYVAGKIKKAGEMGMTKRDISKASRRFRALRPREQDEILLGLIQGGEIVEKEIPPQKKRGRKRTAFVACI